MNKSIGFVLASSILFVGCTPNLYSDPNREICLSYGYRLGTDGFANCMLEQEKMNRKDSRRNNKYSSTYNSPTVHTHNRSKSKVTHNVQQTAVQNVVSDTNVYSSSNSSYNDRHYDQAGKSQKKYLKQEVAREEERRQQRLAEQRMEEARQRSIREAQERQKRENAQTQASIPVAPPPPSIVSNAAGGAKSFHDELAEKLRKRRQQIGE